MARISRYRAVQASAISSTKAQVRGLTVSGPCAVDLAPSTHRIYRDNLRLHILPTFADVPLGSITTEACEPWLIKLRTSGGTRGHLAPASVHQVYRTLHQVMAVATRSRRIGRNPLDGLDPPKTTQRMLGHASAAMTLDRYGHLMPGQAEEIARRLSAAASAAGGSTPLRVAGVPDRREGGWLVAEPVRAQPFGSTSTGGSPRKAFVTRMGPTRWALNSVSSSAGTQSSTCTPACPTVWTG